MYPWISRTLDFWLQFCEKKCGLHMDVYGNLQHIHPGLKLSLNIISMYVRKKCQLFNMFIVFMNTAIFHHRSYIPVMPGCESVLELDGNMKNARQVWSCRDVGELKFAGMDGSVVTGK